MAKREMDVKFEEDGKITITTGDMSGEYHKNAEEFLAFVAQLLGTQQNPKSLKGHVHHHHHGHGDHHHHH